MSLKDSTPLQHSARSVSHTLQLAIASGTRTIQLISSEEKRCLSLIEDIGEKLDLTVHTWSCATGLNSSGEKAGLAQILSRLLSTREPAIWVFFDTSAHLTLLEARRSLRELAQRNHGPTIVLIDPVAEYTISIPEVRVEYLQLPDLDEIKAQLRWIAGVLEQSGLKKAEQIFESELTQLAQSAIGLDLHSIERVVSSAVLADGLNMQSLRNAIHQMKINALDRRGLLESIAPIDLQEIGGLTQFKHWLKRRALAFRPEAKNWAIAPPRGVLLTGVSGCGKSLAARGCASGLGLPLMRLDTGRLFGGTVGESEANFRYVSSIADRMAPMVLWIDEIDKGLSGSERSTSDGGTTARVVAGLLTWLQERKHPVFVVATANRVERLPPELLRRGRLDEIFFVDLPNAEHREAILKVHMMIQPQHEFGVIPPLAGDWEQFATIARAADGYSGAEIEAALTEARLQAFSRSEALHPKDLELAISQTIPLSQSHREEMERLQAWARSRARTA